MGIIGSEVLDDPRIDPSDIGSGLEEAAPAIVAAARKLMSV